MLQGIMNIAGRIDIVNASRAQTRAIAKKIELYYNR